MRHSRRTKRFDRHTGHREAMLKNLARNLIINQQIQTTLAKAKEARRLADKLITLSKEDSLANRRLAYNYLQSRSLVKRLFTEIAPLFKNRPGGYTRVIKSVYRAGDGAQMAILELVNKIEIAEEHKKTKTRKTAEDKKQKSSEQIKPSQKDKSKPKTKRVKEEPLESKEQKKGIISGFRKYLGGKQKNK